MMLKKGTLILFTDGEYSDYTVEGLYELTEDLEMPEDPKQLTKEYAPVVPVSFEEASKKLAYVEVHTRTIYLPNGTRQEVYECQQKE